MIYREILFLFLIGVLVSSCGWNLNSDDGTGGTDPDTTALLKNVSSSNLPSGLSGTTQKARSADFDGDGDLDLSLAIPFAANKILINDGSGSFSDESSNRLPVLDSDTQDLAVADFNSDGIPDLFFVGNQPAANELYINDGRGSFSDLSNRIPVSGNSNSITAQDIDGTGSIDVVIGNLGQNVMLINSGNAFFTDQTTQRLPQQTNNTRDIAFGDITGDNLRDMVVANENGNRVLINTGSGFFVDQTTNRMPFVEQTQDIELLDIDGDGTLDIYFGNAVLGSQGNLADRLLINNGQGLFSDQTANRLPENTTDTIDAEFADLDADGDFDLVLGNTNGGVRVLINNGNGFFSDLSSSWIPEDFFPLVTDLEIADLNGDGLLDLYISIREGNDQLLLQREQ